MTLAIVLAHVWGVIQVILLGSLCRTVRMRTVLGAIAVGLYAIGPLTVLLQLAWIHVAASVLGMSVPALTRLASYSVDPFLEEALKLLPLAMLLLLIPAIRRQWSVTDCVLIAAATGSGYGLAENLYRYAGSPDAAHAIAGGWAIVIGRYTITVPGFANTLTSWLPAGTVFADETILVNSHLVWSAIGGLGVGLILRNRSRAARVVAGALLLYIGLDHAIGNASLVRDSWLSPLAAPFHALATWGGFMVFASVVAAWWLDRPAQRAADALEPLLAAERSASPRIVGTLRAAFSRPPWSIVWVAGFARARRAYHAARTVAAAGQDDLLAEMLAQRDRLERNLADTESPPLLPSALSPSGLHGALRRPAVIVSLVLLAPSIFFLVIGGWPRTAWVQGVMTGRFVWPVVLLITAATQARTAWRVIVGARNWPKTRRLPSGDDAALVGFQLACAVGAVGLGGFALMRVFDGVSAGSSLLSAAHGADAANRATPANASAVANSAGPVAPTPPAPERAPDAAPSPASTPSPKASDANAAPPAPKTQPPRPAPKSNPYDDAAARAEARAAQAEAEALAAQRFRQQAINAQDAADIAKATADPGMDPDVAAARERTRQAHDASEAADRAALDGDDPWDADAPNKTAADIFHREARAAEVDQQTAEKAFADRMAADVESAKAAAKVAEDAMNDAAAKAAAAREAANSAEQARARAADPLGTAADMADKDYAAAHARENAAFENPDAKEYQAARHAAALAKERADEARAAADAARGARITSVIGVDKP